MTGKEKNRKVVFILGTGHCGSTLLDLILGSHSSIFSLGEVNRVLKANSDQRLCDLCTSNCEVWSKESIKCIQNTYKHDFIDKILSKLMDDKTSEVKFYDEIFSITDKKILIDSSKNSKWIKRNGYKLSKSKKYQPYLIYLSRDGRAVINSLNRKNPQYGIEHFANKWIKLINEINSCFENWNFSKKIQIRYKDLAKEPVKTIQFVLNHINLNYEPEMMRFWEHKHHIVNGNAGTKSLILKFQDQHRHKGIDWKLNKKGYYKNHELGIKYDKRWKKEMSIEQIANLNKIISEYNKDLV